MVYEITADSFTKISESSGTIQNADGGVTVEVTNDTLSGGIFLGATQKITFNNTDIYMRCTKEGDKAQIRVVPFIVDAKGGGGGSSAGQGIVIDGTTYHVSENSDVDDLIDEYFPD